MSKVEIALIRAYADLKEAQRQYDNVLCGELDFGPAFEAEKEADVDAALLAVERLEAQMACEQMTADLQCDYEASLPYGGL
jgi:hypothetical protein